MSTPNANFFCDTLSVCFEALYMARMGWFLNMVMARWHITNAELAEKMGRHPTSISRLRTARSMPRMSGEDLGRLCEALSALSGKDIDPSDLLME